MKLGQVQGDSPADAATLEVAHEALLRRWVMLASLLDEDRDALLLLDGVLSAAADWGKADGSHKQDFLAHRGSRLSDARSLASRGPDWEREVAPAQGYLSACAEREAAEREREQAQLARTKKLQRRTGWALGGVFIAVLLALSGAVWESRQTSKREAAVFAGVSAMASAQGFCDRALRFAVAGLPPARGASPISFRSPELQGDLSLYASAPNCRFQSALPHAGWVLSADFSSDGTRVVTGSDDNTARLWDTTTGALLATLSGHSSSVSNVTFSPDGSRVLTASWDNTARLWNAWTGDPLGTFGTDTPFHMGSGLVSAWFRADGSRIVTASMDKTARVWDARTGERLAELDHTDFVFSAVFSPDGSRVVTASSETARIWDARTGKRYPD